MNKKMFAFASLIVALVVAILCMNEAFSNFRQLALPSDSPSAKAIALGILFTLISLALFAGSVVGLVLLIISMIKGKETKLPSIFALGCAGVMILFYDILITYLCIDSSVSLIKAMGNSSSYDAFYAMNVVTNVIFLMNRYIITGIAAILAVLSLITFKKKAKKVEEAKPAE